MQHIQSGVPFLIVSGNREKLSPEENMARNKQLRQKLRAMPVSVIPFDFGEYQEKGQAAPSMEPSYFIMADHALGHTSVQRLKALGWKLRRDFDQDAVVFGDGSNIYFLNEDGTEEAVGNRVSFSMKVVADALGYSQVRGRKFTFASDAEAPEAIRYGEKPRPRSAPKPNLP
jgi:hypothetical protein